MSDSKQHRVKGSSTAGNKRPTKRSVSSASTTKRTKPSVQFPDGKPMTRSGTIVSGAARTNNAAHAGGTSAKHSKPTVSKGRSTRSAGARPSAKATPNSSRKLKPARKLSIGERIITSRPVLIAIAIVVVLFVAGGVDAIVNWDKAFGNVTINGVQVGGKTADEMRESLKDEFGQRVSHSQVTIYANEEARQNANKEPEEQELVDEEHYATAEQISAEDAVASIDSWTTDALSLKASIGYDDAVQKALEVGRSDGGLLERLLLIFRPHDVELVVNYDADALDGLASEIDRTTGDPRVDTTVVVEEGTARAVEGHDGTMVDRPWLSNKLSKAMLAEGDEDSFIAETSLAQSRISLDEAQKTADGINRAIAAGAEFAYQGKTWHAQPYLLGDWTAVTIGDHDGTWKLDTSIDSSLAIPAVVKGADATITSEDVKVTFEKSGNDVLVHTSGSGNIPEVAPAIETLNEALYGESGKAWGAESSTDPVKIDIAESDRPETLSFNDAVDLGVISVIGEYTTEFSNLEGTENRNHNIKLAADILNGGIVEANGGKWVFNDRSGDTNEAAGFWSAGSIVNGEYEDSIGGGICQVATTIFNAVFEAGLDVTERHNHTLYIASYPTGRDAAVSYPDLDLGWQNNLKSDVILSLSYTDTSITAQLFSVYTGYSVTSETGNWEEGRKYTTRFEYDDSLGSGLYYVKTTGTDGSQVTVDRTVNDEDGKVIKQDSFASVYAPKDEVYVVGPDVDTSKLTRTV